MTPADPYRDDGPLVELLGRVLGPSRVPAPALHALAMVMLLAGLLVDGSATGLPTALGVAAYVVLAGSAVGAPSTRLQWLVAPLSRAGEYGFVVWLGWREGPPVAGATFVLLAAVAYHHYDVIHRLVHRQGSPPAWVRRLGGGWDGRMAVLTGAALAGAFAPTVAALTGWCATLYVSSSVWSWTTAARAGRLTPSVAGTGED